jgi:hypothetical protein
MKGTKEGKGGVIRDLLQRITFKSHEESAVQHSPKGPGAVLFQGTERKSRTLLQVPGASVPLAKSQVLLFPIGKGCRVEVGLERLRH